MNEETYQAACFYKGRLFTMWESWSKIEQQSTTKTFLEFYAFFLAKEALKVDKHINSYMNKILCKLEMSNRVSSNLKICSMWCFTLLTAKARDSNTIHYHRCRLLHSIVSMSKILSSCLLHNLR